MMKRVLSLLLSLLLLSAPALADSKTGKTDLTNCAIANGVVQAVNYVDLVAPYSGTLDTFDLAAGDTVKEGDELLRMLTTTLYATEEAEVTAMFATPGADATALMARYGGLAALEPTQCLQMTCTITGAYNKPENKILHVGETLYFRATGGTRGSGVVVMVSGSNYVVDILKGEFSLGESMTLFRSDSYEAAENVGKGTVARRDPLLPAGQGRVAETLVKVGDQVSAGEPLLTLMSADAAPNASPTLTAPCDAVVGTVAVSPGQQVWKGQLLARLYMTDEIEVLAQVDEMDLNDLWVGDKLSVTLDVDADWVMTGTVTEISALGVTQQNAAYYTVHISIPSGDAMLGASASVYIPRD